MWTEVDVVLVEVSGVGNVSGCPDDGGVLNGLLDFRRRSCRRYILMTDV